MSSELAKILFDSTKHPIHLASGSFPTGSVGQVLAGTDEQGKVRYLTVSQQREVVLVEPKIAIAQGNISGSYFKRQYAYSTTTTINQWNQFTGNPGHNQITASNGTRLQIVSTSANDAAAGSGLRQVQLWYIDANLDRQTEILTLNGTTPVLTTATNIRYLDGYKEVSFAVNVSAAAGTVSLKTSPDNVTIASSLGVMDTGGVHFVPRNKTAIFDDLSIYAGSSNNSGYYIIYSAPLPTDGRTFIPSTNIAPYSTKTLHYGTFGESTSYVNKYSDQMRIVIPGPAVYWMEYYNGVATVPSYYYTVYEQ